MRPSSMLAEELAEREGFEIGRGMKGISKLLMRILTCVPSNPPNSPYLPPDLPPEERTWAKHLYVGLPKVIAVILCALRPPSCR